MFKIFKRYSLISLIFAFSFNMIVYIGSRMIAGNWHHYNIESSFDIRIPFWPPSAIIYLGCYLFWAINYILISRQEKKEICQFFSADFISRVICFVIYILFPTTNTRPEINPDGFWNQIMIFLYSVDAADNLFPSIHCLVSWFCYIALRGKKQYPLWYRGFSCVMALLVCLSTLLTKQHVIIDVVGGIVLAEVCYYIGKHTSIWKIYERILDKINAKIFTEKRE